MAVKPCVGDNRRRAKGAFCCVHGFVEFGLRAAVGARHDAGFFDFFFRDVSSDSAAKIELLQGAAGPGAPCDFVGVATMIADQLIPAGVKAKVSAALIAGKAVFGGRAGGVCGRHALQITVKHLGRHNP